MSSKYDHRQEHGFSLVEVAIALVVISMVMVPIFSYYKVVREQKQITDTNTKLANIENAINQFFFAGNGRYPCPASLVVDENNDQYGEEFATCNSLGTIRLCTDLGWRTNEGLCKTSTDPNLAVLIGAVPFDKINLTAKNTLDVWGNRILYAVTYTQTDTANFNLNSGQIEIRADWDDDNDKETPPLHDGDVTDTSDKPDFLILSTGMGAIGAFNKNGIASAAACDTVNNITESRNCDFDNIFYVDVNPNDPDIGSRSFADNNTYYDDITRFQTSVPQAIWFPHPTNPNHVMTMSTRVGIGIDTPQETLDVDGEIRANGAIKSDDICLNADKTVCFNPQFITREHQCIGDTSAGTVRMSNNALQCASGYDGNTTNGEPFSFGDDFKDTPCPDPLIQQGFDALGDPICVTN